MPDNLHALTHQELETLCRWFMYYMPMDQRHNLVAAHPGIYAKLVGRPVTVQVDRFGNAFYTKVGDRQPSLVEREPICDCAREAPGCPACTGEPCITCEGGCAVCGSKDHDCRIHTGEEASR